MHWSHGARFIESAAFPFGTFFGLETDEAEILATSAMHMLAISHMLDEDATI